MKRVTGSSPLTAESQEFYRDREGVTIHAIAENPIRQSRRVRRALKFRRNHERLPGVTGADIDVARRQYELEQKLRDATLRPG